jgi:hypothetical protein
VMPGVVVVIELLAGNVRVEHGDADHTPRVAMIQL